MSPNLPPELWQHVINMLNGPQNLRSPKSCALVCRAFAYAAQPLNVFRSIVLLADPIESVVAGSTHPRATFLSMELPLLQSLHLVAAELKPGSVIAVPEATSLTILAEFITFPAISSIFLRFLTFAGPHDFERIVRGSGSSVKALTLQRIRIRRLGRALELWTRLHLLPSFAHRSLALSELLNAPLCPLDLQNLVDVTFTGFMSTALLKTSQSTINRLVFTQEDFLGGLDVAFPLTVLTQVSFNAVRAQAFGAVVERLSQCPALPLLRKIVTGFDAPSYPQHLPTLQRLQFSLADTKSKSAENVWFPGPNVASKRELVEGFLPALKARGVLVVKSC
ncbi:hypothetical protein C8F04DRAFT_1184571 [Mycena alexandri]|uniref:F-box domain-containing protein n=1 Tax=Mycena alexandri TaxID=1745969 RepID=A0AAD6STN7_9AGAR|nr:hypothetical protein C8F04DRAFT_1184571 [Mycena alexandri]